MFLRIIMSNFLSYRNEVQFDMFPNFKRQALTDHIYDGETAVLKQAAIYGGNGTGKSNLIHAMWFVKSFATNPDFLKTNEIAQFQHKLQPDAEKKNIKFTIEFKHRDFYYLYDVEISADKIEQESLRLSGLGKRKAKLIFERKGLEVNTPNTPIANIQKAMENLIQKNPLSSLLSLNSQYPILNSDHADNATDWFQNGLIVVPLYANLTYIVNLMYKRADLLEFTRKTFADIDLGIDNIRVDYEQADEYIKKHLLTNKSVDMDSLLRNVSPQTGVTAFKDNKPVFDVILEDGVKKIGEMIVRQEGLGGSTYDMGLSSQSDGTIKLLMLMPVFYDLIQKDVTMFVDEINHPIHPLLIKRLVRLFADNKNSKGQLIYTTHETELLDNSFMRTDEVWLTEKHEGSTELYSLNEFKLHKNISMKNGYLEGRYGGVPMFNKLVDEFHEVQ